MDRLASNHRNTSRLRHRTRNETEIEARIIYTPSSVTTLDFQPSAYWYDQPSAYWQSLVEISQDFRPDLSFRPLT